MRIAIVDDVTEERTLLTDRLKQQLCRRGIYEELFEYTNGEDFLADAEKQNFAVVFLDIYMDGADGIKTAREFRTFAPDTLLVFTTTSTDHALDGFRVRAMHYLVKPYHEEELSVLIDEILTRIPNSGKYIEIKTEGSNVQIPFQSIIYAEHFSHMIHIHTTGKKELVTRQSLETFRTSLKMDSRFYQCNRGIIINLEHAVDFHENVFVLDDNITIPVSRRQIKEARQTFMEFLFQRNDYK